MDITPDDDRIVYMREEDIDAANGIVQVLRNHWFSVHPERGLLFWQTERRRKGKLIGAAPQCNGDKATAEFLASKMYPWAQTRFYPLVLLPIDVRDYAP